MSHRRMQRAVTAFIDDELEPARAAIVAAHLRGCWGCTGDVELARMVKASLRHLADRDRDVLTTRRLQRFAARLGP